MQRLDRISRPRFDACKNVSRRKERLRVFLGINMHTLVEKGATV
jgi:hypothetical protein